jgi:hypothetical protein
VFLRLLFILLLAGPSTRLHAQAADAKSPVWFVRNENAGTGYEPDPVVVRRMVNDIVAATTDARNATAAWKSLAKPSDRVGVKIAAPDAWREPLHRAVVDAVVKGLRDAGVPRANITVWSGGHLRTDYDRKAVFTSPLTGSLIWGDVAFSGKRGEDQSDESHWHRLLCGGITKIINVSTLSAHESVGVAGAVYNVTIPNIDNWRRFVSGAGAADPYLCELFADGHVRPKIVLNIVDGLGAQFAGGPEGGPNHAFAHQTLYASRDAVALDATAFRLIEKWRAEAKLPPLGGRAAYLQTAEAMGLGKYDEAQIEMREVK